MTDLQRFFEHIFSTFNLKSIGTYMVYGIVVGIVAGLGAVLFFFLCQIGLHYFLDMLAGYRPAAPFGEPPLFGETSTPLRRYLLIVIPTIGGLLSGYLVYRFAPEAEGHGTDAAIDAFHNRQGRIRKRVPIIKTIASALTLGSGGSGGREGPIALIGAGFGSFLADRLNLDSRQRRILLAAGMGAGIGSIFRAPLAGALFAAEILYNDPEFETEVLIPAFVTTIVAYSTFGLFFGFEPLFAKSTYSFSHPLELLPYTILGLAAGLAAPLYVKAFYGTKRFFDKLSIPNIYKPAIGAFLTGCIGFFLPQTLAFGYGVIQGALDNTIAVHLLLMIAVGKILTTALTIGSGGSGGVFGPSMVIGGTLGGAIGNLSARMLPAIAVQPGAFVIVGMAGFFAAASNAPISTIIMVSEMTGNYNLLVPAMWACSIAFIIGRRWHIYEKQVPSRADSPAHYGDFVRDLLEDMHVRDIFDPGSAPRCVPENMRLRDFIPIMTDTNQQTFPIIDAEGNMTGIFDLNDVRDIMVERDLDNIIIMKEIADEQVATAFLTDNLAEVLQKFVEYESDMLPVVEREDSRKLLGMIRRSDVISSYYRRMNELKEERMRMRST